MPGIVLIGAQWGDEGKGKATDLIGTKVDYVARFNGGNNAGHTVVVGDESYALHLLPSGIFRKGVVNILGNGVALDCESLWTEMSDVMDQGVAITPENLKISDRASLLLPWHRELDALEEQRLKDKKYGSTKQGIAPFYSDKYQKKTVMAGELLHPQHLKEHLADLLEWKNLTLQKVYGAKGYTLDAACELPLVTYFDRKQAEDAATNGNGRMARNTLEKAILNQSKRLVADPDASLELLVVGDFELE